MDSQVYHKVLDIEKNLDAYKAHSGLQEKVKRIIHHPYFELAIIVLVVLMLTFLTFKAGFSMWLLSKLSYEKFGTGRGEPDFWEIGSELANYKRRQAPGFTPSEMGRAQASFDTPKEHMSGDNPISIRETDHLASVAYGL